MIVVPLEILDPEIDLLHQMGPLGEYGDEKSLEQAFVSTHF